MTKEDIIRQQLIEEYWRAKLADRELPVWLVPPAEGGDAPGAGRFRLDPEVTARIEALSKGKDLAAYVIYLSCFRILLYKYFGANDVVVAAPGPEDGSATRMHFFRNVLRPEESVKGLVREVGREVQETLGYPGYAPAGPPAGEGLLQFAFHYGPAGRRLPAAGLQLALEKHPDGSVTGTFSGDPARLASWLVDGMPGHFRTLLAGALADLNAPVEAIPMLTGEETQRLLLACNDTQAGFPAGKTLDELFEAQAARIPHAVAVRCGDRQLTFGELNGAANQLAHYLRQKLAVQPDDRVALQMDRSEWMLIAILGILKAGAAYVPIDPDFPAERIGFMRRDAGVKATLTRTPGQATPLPGETPAPVVVALDQEWPAITTYPTHNPGRCTTAANLAYVIYTSGSTGRPKGVMLEHAGVVNRVDWMWKHYGFAPDDVILQKTPNIFDVSVWEIFMPLCYGMQQVQCRKEEIADPEQLALHVRRYGVTTMHFVPALFNVFVDTLDAAAWAALPSLRRIFTSGEALPAETVRRYYRKSRVPLHNLYGPTEAAVDVTYYPVQPGDQLIPIGKPIANMRVYVLDAGRQLLPPGVEGDICLAGIGLARGYVNRPELTAEKFFTHTFAGLGPERLYRTGDRGRWLPDGNLAFTGRADGQVKIRGYRIETGEIENVLMEQPGVESAVVAVHETAGDRQLVAYLVGVDERQLPALRTRLKELLPAYMIPAHWVPLTALPLTPTGKVDRKALPRATAGRGTTPGERVAPRNATERTLVEIWEEVLGVRGIGVTDHFFDLGGHSLNATRIIVRIYKELGTKIKLRSLYTHPTVATLAGVVSSAEQETYQGIEPVAEQAHYALSSAQRRLWIIDQFEDSRNAYNMPGAYVFEGDVDRPAFDKAFETLVRRHESLRTIFGVVQGEPRQRILSFESLGFAVMHLDLREVPGNEQVMQQLVSETAAVAFDLQSGPLLVVKLLRLAESRYACLITMHHIISDAWSKQVLVREVLALYEAYRTGQTPALPPLRVQYKDYAAWHTRQLAAAGFDRHRAYWARQLDQYTTLELPTDYPRPAVKAYKGSGVHFVVDARCGRPLADIGRRRGASLFATLLASVGVMLGKYAGQEDMVLGTPVAGRDHPDLEDQIGFYVNSLPLRLHCSPADSFVQVLDKVKDVALEAYEHQAYPFDSLVDELDVDREPGRHPLFDVMVQLENVNPNDPDEEMRGVTVGGLDIEMTSCKYDLVIDFSEAGGWISASIRYNTDLFTKASITRMGRHFTQLVQCIVTDPDQPTGALSMYDEEEAYLHQLWQSVLALPGSEIPYNGHFYALGGDDGKAGALCGRINQRYGINLTAGEVRLYPVFRRLLTHLQRCRAAAERPAAGLGIVARAQ